MQPVLAFRALMALGRAAAALTFGTGAAAASMNAPDNPFHRPLQLESHEGAHGVRGDARGIIGHAFALAAEALSRPEHWCDVLSLHLNIKYCRPSAAGTSPVLHISIGSKAQQPLAEAHRVNLAYRVVTNSPDHLQVALTADEGPMGTSDYRIVLDATPAERNTMRYYLAIESFLGALTAAPQDRTEKSMQAWFEAVERFPRQLHEMERAEYLEMKRREYARQRAPP